MPVNRQILMSSPRRPSNSVTTSSPSGSAGSPRPRWLSNGGPSLPRPIRPHCERVVIVASSLHTVDSRTVQALPVDVEPPEVQATEVTVLTPDLTALSCTRRLAVAWLETVSSTASTPIVIVDAPEERTSSTDLVADLLAGAAATLMRDSVPTSLMLLGRGKEHAGVLNRLGAVSLRIHSTVREGMPIGAIEGGRAHGATVITKAGGFGRRSGVLEIAAELLHNERRINAMTLPVLASTSLAGCRRHRTGDHREVTFRP